MFRLCDSDRSILTCEKSTISCCGPEELENPLNKNIIKPIVWQMKVDCTWDSRIGDLPEKHSDMGIYGPLLSGDMGEGESLSTFPSSIGDFSSCSSTISTSELSPTD